MTDSRSREKSLHELEFNYLNIHLYLTLNYGTASEHLDFDFMVLYNAFVLSWSLTITQNSIHTQGRPWLTRGPVRGMEWGPPRSVCNGVTGGVWGFDSVRRGARGPVRPHQLHRPKDGPVHTLSDLDRSRLSDTRSAENDRIGADTDPEYRIDVSLVQTIKYTQNMSKWPATRVFTPFMS